MQSENSAPPTPPKPKRKAINDYLRVSKETKRKILSELSQINRKDFGKPVTPDQFVSLAISLLTPEHLGLLRTQSLTNQDRLKLKYQEYCNAHGKISMDAFLGLLLK